MDLLDEVNYHSEGFVKFVFLFSYSENTSILVAQKKHFLPCMLN